LLITDRCLRLGKLCHPAPAKRKRREERPVFSTTAATSRKLQGSGDEAHGSQTVQDLNRQEPLLATPARSGACNIVVPQQQNRPGDITFSGLKSDLFNRASPLNDWMSLLVAAQVSAASDQLTVHPAAFKETQSSPGSSLVATPASPASNSCAHESEDELQECLESYRTNSIPQYPAVYIRPEVTVVELSEERPFLWLVIRAVCSKSAVRQATLALEARQVLAREMLVEGTRSLDLLLGLLVMGAWSHIFLKQQNKPILNNIIQLAVALASDLGLTKPYPEDPVRTMSDCNVSTWTKPPTIRTLHRTTEERRAVVGLFWISSV
jgi:hypothetical protein